MKCWWNASARNRDRILSRAHPLLFSPLSSSLFFSLSLSLSLSLSQLVSSRLISVRRSPDRPLESLLVACSSGNAEIAQQPPSLRRNLSSSVSLARRIKSKSRGSRTAGWKGFAHTQKKQPVRKMNGFERGIRG